MKAKQPFVFSFDLTQRWCKTQFMKSFFVFFFKLFAALNIQCVEFTVGHIHLYNTHCASILVIRSTTHSSTHLGIGSKSVFNPSFIKQQMSAVLCLFTSCTKPQPQLTGAICMFCRDVFSSSFFFWKENDNIAKCISHLPGNNEITWWIGLLGNHFDAGNYKLSLRHTLLEQHSVRWQFH